MAGALAAEAAANQGAAHPPRPGAPAVLLVHGFGAFGEQWRGQVRALTRAGYQVRCAPPPEHCLRFAWCLPPLVMLWLWRLRRAAVKGASPGTHKGRVIVIRRCSLTM